jgi:hypothetical protein
VPSVVLIEQSQDRPRIDQSVNDHVEAKSFFERSASPVLNGSDFCLR